MMCDRCHKPIPEGEAVERDIQGGSGGGITVYLHRELCQPTRPSPRRHPLPPLPGSIFVSRRAR